MMSNGVGLPGAKGKRDFLSVGAVPLALKLEHKADRDHGSCIRMMG